jgi:hypothetical protein
MTSLPDQNAKNHKSSRLIEMYFNRSKLVGAWPLRSRPLKFSPKIIMIELVQQQNQSPQLIDHNLPNPELKISTSSTALSNSLSSATSNSSTSSGVRGPEGQLCESKAVLDAILTKYNHINQNLFKGGANGKIKAEFMMCECRYNHCKIFFKTISD